MILHNLILPCHSRNVVFKATVSEIKERMEPLESNLKYGPYSKSKFGMIVPEVETMLEDKHIQSVVLFGVEVCTLLATYRAETQDNMI